MEHPAWLVLFFVAIAIGYWLGRKDGRRRQRKRVDNLSREYMRGLNYLLNEEPDKAVDIFVSSLEITPHTLETHLALARLFRKRGELDRATRLHSNLLEYGELPGPVREQVELELARDYIAAGVLDRAEDILQRMLERNTGKADEVRRHLLSIFEQEKDWNSALAVGDQLVKTDPAVAPVLAHYCCQLAERMGNQDELNAARRTLRRALQYDETCVRASILLGRLEMNAGNWETAIRCFRRVQHQDPTFFDEVLDDLERCYQELDRGPQLNEYLARVAVETPSTAVILKLADRLRSRYGDKAASLFIADYMKAHPTVRGLDRIIEMNIEAADGNTREHFGILRRLTRQLIEQQAAWQCTNCGYGGQHLHWQCPTCKQWGTLRPHRGQEERL